MEIVLAAIITAFGSVIIALITRGSNDARRGRVKAEEAATLAGEAVVRAEQLGQHTMTNGSAMTLGELAEAIFQDGRDTKNAVRRLDRKVEKHLGQPVSVAHPEEGL